jgi:hypothetical protein
MRESRIEEHLRDASAAMGGLAVKHVSPGRAGDPDRLVALPVAPCAACGCRARVGLLELKAPGKEARALQEARHREWAALGVPVGVADTRRAVELWLERLAAGCRS